jgi:hypothetical protein
MFYSAPHPAKISDHPGRALTNAKQRILLLLPAVQSLGYESK